MSAGEEPETRDAARVRSVNADTSVAIVGSGRVAQAVGRLLAERGEPIVAVAARSAEQAVAAARFIAHNVRPVSLHEAGGVAGRLIVAVSDDALRETAELLARGLVTATVALHTSGAFGPDGLSPLANGGVSCGTLHPLQTIASAEQGLAAIPGCAFGITAQGPALDWAVHLTRRLGGRPLFVPAEHRALYHAAAVIAGNYPAALAAASVELLVEAGIDRGDARAALLPLTEHAARNLGTLGIAGALTGPVARGDADTIRRHLAALRDAPPAIARLYVAACRCLLPLAAERGVSAAALDSIDRLLTAEEDIHA